MIEVFICEAADGTGDKLYFFRREDLLHYVTCHTRGDVFTSSVMCTEEAAQAFVEAADHDVTLH